MMPRRYAILALLGAFILAAGAQYGPKTGQIPQAIQVMGFSSTPAFDASNGNVFKITLTGNVTSSTLVNGAPAGVYTFIICQDSAGLHSFIWPTSFKGVVAIPVTAIASTCASQTVVWEGTTGYATAIGLLNL